MKPKLTNYRVKSRDGFTLVELLIVMAMTAIIATISLANYRAGEKQKRVSLAADGITSALSLAQTYALAGKSTNNSNAACRVPQYYFVSFNYSSTNYALSALNNCAGTDIIEIFPLPEGVRIKAAGLKIDGASATTKLYIFMLLPFGATTAVADNGSAAARFLTSTITVETIDGTISKMVTVDGVSFRIGL